RTHCCICHLYLLRIHSLSDCFLQLFFSNDTATAKIYSLSLHDALPILAVIAYNVTISKSENAPWRTSDGSVELNATAVPSESPRSEEHTSELQSRFDLVCRLLLEKKKTKEYIKQTVRRKLLVHK